MFVKKFEQNTITNTTTIKTKRSLFVGVTLNYFQPVHKKHLKNGGCNTWWNFTFHHQHILENYRPEIAGRSRALCFLRILMKGILMKMKQILRTVIVLLHRWKRIRGHLHRLPPPMEVSNDDICYLHLHLLLPSGQIATKNQKRKLKVKNKIWSTVRIKFHFLVIR